MKTSHNSVLTYCTNIHPGNTWKETIDSFEANIPQIRKTIGVEEFAVGLRMGKQPLDELLTGDTLASFGKWLEDNNLFVRSINGFPYGNFHNTVVKDDVHAPDWTTQERINYTLDLVKVLAEILPPNTGGGISTSPLTYRPWHEDEALESVYTVCAKNLIQVLTSLIDLFLSTGIEIHVDIEPEPDGLLETSDEFVSFFKAYLIPIALKELKDKYQMSDEDVIASLKRHITVCFDVCHFAVVFEDVKKALANFQKEGIRIGRVQISAALEARSEEEYEHMLNLNEPTYLHQVAIKDENGGITRSNDLNQQTASFQQGAVARTHFHVPIFEEKYQYLHSTQSEIVSTLSAWKKSPFTEILEVETYTFDVLDQSKRLNLQTSIVRELEWANKILKD